MENEKEYYLGYLRDPRKTPKNGFDDIEEMEVVLIHEHNEYRELITLGRVFPLEKNQVFDGHQFTKSRSEFIGRVGKKLEQNELNSYLTKIRENNMEEYVEKINKLMQETGMLGNKLEEEYQEERQKFASEFGIDATSISDKAKFTPTTKGK